MKIITDNTSLMRFVPNSIAPVKGETTLFDKISVHLQLAEQWVCDTFTSDSTLTRIASYTDSNMLKHYIGQIIVAEALHRAVPSLDLVMTPNGFGIVSNNTITPASKQRVDRLLGNLIDLRDDAIENALLLLPEAHAWADSRQSQFFGATLFPNIDLATLCGVNSNRWTKYIELRSRVFSIEQSLADEYFSPELMDVLRRQFLFGDLSVERLKVVHLIRSQIVDVLLDRPINGTRMRDCVNYIRYNPTLFHEWQNSETAKLFSPPKFENDKKAKGYFF